MFLTNTLEPIEPRVLLSADLSYTTFSAGTFTLQASGTTLNLLDGSSAVVASATLGSDGKVTIERAGGAAVGALFGDTLNIDLSSLGSLNGHSEVAAGLSILVCHRPHCCIDFGKNI